MTLNIGGILIRSILASRYLQLVNWQHHHHKQTVDLHPREKRVWKSIEEMISTTLIAMRMEWMKNKRRLQAHSVREQGIAYYTIERKVVSSRET